MEFYRQIEVAISYSRRSSHPKDQTRVSVSPALANRFFNNVLPGLVFIPLGLLAPRRLTQAWTQDGLSVPRVRRIQKCHEVRLRICSFLSIISCSQIKLHGMPLWKGQRKRVYLLKKGKVRCAFLRSTSFEELPFMKVQP